MASPPSHRTSVLAATDRSRSPTRTTFSFLLVLLLQEACVLETCTALVPSVSSRNIWAMGSSGSKSPRGQGIGNKMKFMGRLNTLRDNSGESVTTRRQLLQQLATFTFFPVVYGAAEAFRARPEAAPKVGAGVQHHEEKVYLAGKEDQYEGKILTAVSKPGEFRNWAATVQTAPAQVFRPQSIQDVQDILGKARAITPPPKIRCMGASHSWSPLFADNDAWLIDTRGLADLTWSSTQNPTQVTIGPGVTGGQLSDFFDSKDRGEWRGMYLESDTIVETVTYGGIINAACHGAGKTQTLPDYVLAMSIVKFDGTRVDLRREDDPAGFARKVVHFGLLGVSVAYTLQLDSQRTAIKITDSKHTAREYFLDDTLPKKGGPNPLQSLWEKHFAVEIFYWTASSLETNRSSRKFEDQRWDPYNDLITIKAFDRTDNPVPEDDDAYFGLDRKGSTRFDRHFGITDWLNIYVGTKLGVALAAQIGNRPSLMSLYAREAAKGFQPSGQTTGQVSYETSLAQAIHWQRYMTGGPPVSSTEICIKCDPDFTSAYRAIHTAISITKSFAEEEGTLPLNVAMEMRFTKHSDSPMSPAYGNEGDIFFWIEIVSAVNTPRLKDYNTKVADAWLAINLKDGSQAARPHWAKFSEAYVLNADEKMKKAYADRLPVLKTLAAEYDPQGVFVNEYFGGLLA